MKINNGFTLIEVLIAMLILAVGLLGLAGLQASGLRNNQSAYYRSQATQLTYDMTDRMRANKTDAQQYGASIYNTAVKDPKDAVIKNDCRDKTKGCTAAEMAENDLYEWNIEVTSRLPLGWPRIAVTGSFYTISISWDDNRDGAVDNKDPTFQMVFQI